MLSLPRSLYIYHSHAIPLSVLLILLFSCGPSIYLFSTLLLAIFLGLSLSHCPSHTVPRVIPRSVTDAGSKAYVTRVWSVQRRVAHASEAWSMQWERGPYKTERDSRSELIFSYRQLA